MILPKELIIAGREYKIKKNPKSAGGNGNIRDCIITIGTRLPKEIPILFIHEVLEVIMFERGVRFDHTNDLPYELLFSFNHKEYENIACDLAFALKNVNFQNGNQIKDKKNGQKKDKKEISKQKESSSQESK